MPAMRHEGTALLKGYVQECVADCLDCFEAATECVAYCLSHGSGHECFKHLRLLMDCAAICQVSADFMLRESDMRHLTCGVCEAICARCARNCDGIDSSDGRWRRCAEACRRCAESCQDMVAHHAAANEINEVRDELTN